MIEIEETILLKNTAFTTDYQFSLNNNVMQFDTVDFFVYINDTESNAVNKITCAIEYTGKLDPGETDWCRISIETFDNSSKVYQLHDYIVEKEITGAETFSIRCRAQGRLIRLAIKANAAGGDFTVGILKKKRR